MKKSYTYYSIIYDFHVFIFSNIQKLCELVVPSIFCYSCVRCNRIPGIGMLYDNNLLFLNLKTF